MNSVGVVGAGTMGGGIAHVAAAAGFETFLHDISPELLERGMGRISAEVARGVGKGRTTPEEASAILSRITARPVLEELGPCGIIIEAAAEDLQIKRAIFTRLAAAAGKSAILATNTSSLSVTALASGLPDPGRFLGLHFFNPPAAMKLVEVIRGSATTDATVGTAIAFSKRLGKVP
ncbi:MAG TPA: 3-hydroxyacyl-CoA dehydrogenase NAD-binding domain-containing protein, partial [Bacteroidota bacterium]|nr:3-hydroxyacyl-CoA dehydrogenase NAD-binding domain-containing protein [Bacteroidota bacterium]